MKPSSRLLSLKPGVYALKLSCSASKTVPIVTLGYHPDTSENGSIKIMGKENSGQVTLDHDGAMAIAWVTEATASLYMTIFTSSSTSSKDVKILVDRLLVDVGDDNLTATSPSTSNVFLSGHVEWQGDVELSPGVQLGEPSQKNRIEGFAVHWTEKPNGVDISYGCTVRGQGPTDSVLSGDFVGTRQRAAPINSIWFELVGPNANAYELSAEAIFSETGPILGQSGDTLKGYSTRDYLTGLKIDAKSTQKLVNVAEQKNPENNDFGIVKTFKRH